MNPILIDYLESILNSWYGYLARWDAPGAGGDDLCELCTNSPFVDGAGLADWPHDVTHPFIEELDLAVAEVRDWYRAEVSIPSTAPSIDAPVATPPMDGAVAAVYRLVAQRSSAIADVLNECIEPKLQSYVSGEVARMLV
jgi:hypothetical protein